MGAVQRWKRLLKHRWLDETDAALDEANSRKYGDMIENLAKLFTDNIAHHAFAC